MSLLRHVSYNLLDYGRRPVDERRLTRVRATIGDADGDVYSIQEIYGETPEERSATFAELANSLGMEYRAPAAGDMPPSEPVFDPGRGVRGVGVMWRPGRIVAVAGTRRIYDRTRLHGGMAMVRLRIEDQVDITVASSHWAPRYPRHRADDAVYQAVEIARLGGHAVLGGDYNEVFPSDPDPYETVPWDPQYLGKAQPTEHGYGRARHDGMHELRNGGLHDPADRISADWFATTGHWGENTLAKRIDGPWVTEAVAAAAVSIRALATPVAEQASDHLPVLLDIDLDAIPWGRPRPLTGTSIDLTGL